MFNQIEFGKRLKNIRKAKNLTQSEVALRIEVSEQAVSKWENGECLPDVYNLKLLARLLHISIDRLLEDDDTCEKVVDEIKIGGAVFEIIDKSETILAGKIIYENSTIEIEEALEKYNEEQRKNVFDSVIDAVKPISDIHLSIDFWKHGAKRGIGVMRETSNINQPQELDVFIMPKTLFIKAYTDKATANLLTKDKCEIWELFAYIRAYFMPTHGYKMAENGAQEMEVFDTAEHTTGYAYMPVVKI